MENASSPDGESQGRESLSIKRSQKVRKTLSRAFSKELRTPENLGDDSDPPKKGEGTLAGLVAAGRLQARRRAARSPTSSLRLGSGVEDETAGPVGPSLSSPSEAVAKSPSGSSMGSFRRRVRRSMTSVPGIPGISTEEDEAAAPSAGGTARLMMLTSAVSTFQQAVKEKVEDVVVGDPNEVILDSDDDSDDEENEEIERDFVSALQRVQDSGRLSINELRVFEKELKEWAPALFEEESDMAILAGLQNARYLEVKCDDVLWSRYSELYPGILSCESPICILVKGKMSVAKPGIPEGVKVLKGSVINAADPDVLGIIAVEPCKLMYVDSTQVEEDMDRAKTAWSRVDRNLRKKRPTSTWPEDLLDDLLTCVRHMPFFENFDDRTMRSILRNLRFQHIPVGESLPPRQDMVTSTTGTASRPESHLVMFWEGKAGKYKRVQSADQRMISAQLEMMALEGLSKKSKALASPQDKDMPELDEAATKDNKVYLKRYGNLRVGAVLGERDLIDPGGPETGQPIVRCEGPCDVLTLARADYLHCLKEQQVERMRVVHALRNVAASRPGEPHHRSPEQLSLLAKLVRNTPELKNFDQDALMQVLGAATFISAAPGHILCHQGEVGDRFFAIIEGMVSIHVRPKTDMDSALATAAESKGTGATLIKTMLAALSQHRVEEAKKEKEKPKRPAPIQSSPSAVSAVSADFSRAPSIISDGSPSQSPSPSASFLKDKRGSPRKKMTKVSFGGEEELKNDPENSPPTPLSPQIVIAVADGEDDPDLSSLTSPLMSPVSSSRQSSQDEESDSGVPMTRRKSLKDRLRGGLFWSGIKKRVASSNSSAPVRDLGKMVNRMGPGAAFGAKTLLKKDARTASVQTVEPTKMLVVTREDYVGLIGSMEEARAREAAEFLCRHVLMVEVRASSNRALDNLHPALRQRMARTSKAMTSHSLDRGMVLLTHGTETSDIVNILRKGSLAFCYPNEQQGCPDRWYRSKRACMNPSQVVSIPGELVGVHKALLDCKEPATVRVESAYCEVYRVPWTELQRVLTSRVLSMMKDKLQRCHALRSGVAATQSPKDMLTVAASSSIVGAVPSREQQAVKDALENAFSAACSFEVAGESHGEAMTWNQRPRPQRSQRPQSHRERVASKAKAPQVPKVPRIDEDSAQFVETLTKAVAKLKDTTARADLWESLRTGEADAVHAAPSLPPPITSDAHVRARFFKVLKDDPGLLGMEKFLTDCMLDPEKANLNAWIKKYTSSEKLRKHSELQSLQMILRKQVKNPARLARSPT